MNYVKIKIEPPFHLEEVAKEYKISEEELRTFHNQHCGLTELMPQYFPKYIEFVYLPTTVYENRQKQLLPSKKLTFLKASFLLNTVPLLNTLMKIYYKFIML